ncbi:SLBB domain-containing protein [Desulfovibrio inopinatus]|uniref:SLBB domain-containing protein n=1 Tax=Desulfovibrio inopinatus TaxID=102109 RepID=UPI000403A1E8|nr:SLBB domain-containing protein [Desulfovibrio inopinatus]
MTLQILQPYYQHEHSDDVTAVDIVVIGINGEKVLEACFDSIDRARRPHLDLRIIYVDGGSNDTSISIAQNRPDVCIIDDSGDAPTPGRQRNSGYQAGTAPYIQFMDCDTTLDKDWLEHGLQALTNAEMHVGAVCGLRQERFPNDTVYNAIADIEWNGPAGPTNAFGGDVLIRREVIEAVNGYDDILVAGEDPELSQRIIDAGWTILRLNVPMTTHDIAMKYVGQYWRRSFRTGYGYAAVSARHGATRGFWVAETQRILLRGGISCLSLPACITLLALGKPFLAVACLLLGLYVLFRPFLGKKNEIARQNNISPEFASTYALHCSVVVIPQCFGALRYYLGCVLHLPLKNKSRRLKSGVSRLTMLMLCVVAFALTGCPSPSPKPTPIDTNGGQTSSKGFTLEPVRDQERYADPATVEAFSNEVPDEYQLGPGDVLDFSVWNRPELSRKEIVISPDGQITLPRIGILDIEGKSMVEATELIKSKLGKLYERPEVALSIVRYNNNKAFVLGRVSNPGVVHFPGRGTLLEALALAGGLPVIRQEAFLTKCSIIRGRDTIIWIDLRSLLNDGNVALNARLKNNDVVFIPESDDELVYVMGEVETPGALKLKTRLTLLDAIMMSGGPTDTASLERVYLIRFDGKKGTVLEIDLKDMIETGQMTKNYMLQDNDVVYVDKTGMARFNYALEQIMPTLQILQMGTSIVDMTTSIRDKLKNDLSTGSDLGFINSVSGQNSSSSTP